MIEYVEVRNAAREVVGIIDTANSILWHNVYYGVGDFEIYIKATPATVLMLAAGRYITRPDNDKVGIIEKLNITFDLEKGRMIAATGRFAKSILDRRLIYKLSGKQNAATILSGKVETAVRTVVTNNAINCPFDSRRNISILELGALANLPEIIVDAQGQAAQKQVSYENLLTYTDDVLHEYGLAAKVILNNATKKLQYVCYKGIDRSVDNADGNEQIIFSQEFDNLTESEYTYDVAQEKNAALIGGEGEGLDRFYSLVAGNGSDLTRKEVWVDASSIQRKYKDQSDVEHEYTDAEYKALLDNQGKQTLSTLIKIESFSGTIDITGGQWLLNRDFWLGDIVTVQDDEIGKYINARITETLETQDENGYKCEVVYE